jgi:serine O-acetyltransferase
MIKTRSDLKYYISEDRKANDLLPVKPGTLNQLKFYFKLFFDKRIKFHTILRKYEYYSNSNYVLFYVVRLYYYYRFKSLSFKLGFTVHKNCFGPGLCIKHYGSIVVNPHTRVGSNCTIHICVNIGETNGKAPLIGDNVYIGPGAKIFGPITIGNNVKIGANAVVNKSFEEDNVVLAGVPASIVKRF